MMDQAANLRKMIKGESEKISNLMKEEVPRAVAAGKAPRVISVTSGKGGGGKDKHCGEPCRFLSALGKESIDI